MIDANLTEHIARVAKPQAGENIVEVGPGFGALTRELIKSGANVTSIEFDSRLAAYLRANLRAPNFSLIESDAMDIDYTQFSQDPNQPFRLVANLPYAISSPLIAKLLELPSPPEEILVLLQKETAERFAADVDTKSYGALSVRVQIVFDARYERTIPPEVFYPKPEVESALVSFKRLSSLPPLDERQNLSRLVKLAFSARRKKLVNTLASRYPKTLVKETLTQFDINPDARPEDLTPSEFLALSNALSS